MRFGHLRGVMLAVVLMGSMATVRSASADLFDCTLPKEVLARDLNTGGPYMAPPVPWGHYAKDGPFDHFYKKHCGICGLLLGKGTGCCLGHGLLGHKGGKGDDCGKKGCGHCGSGLFHHGADGCDDSSCGLFNCGFGHGKRIKNCGLCGGKGCGICTSSGVGDPFHSLASPQSAPAPVPASPQAPAKVVVTSQMPGPMASPQGCTEPGCTLGKGHHHGGSSMGDLCGGCGGKGCGLCGGLGKLFHHGDGDPCGNCGGKGCGLCGGAGKHSGKHGNVCHNCGGKGCHLCSALKGKLYGLLHPHAGEIKYFVGAGGPVPLTPGYVPYIVTTRSPRDFLAFPPYTPDGF
jgi:hypothetical protein